MDRIELTERKVGGSVVCLLSRRDVCERIRVGKSKLYQMMKAGRFPKCHHIDTGLFRWRSDEVDAWINAHAPAAEVAA